MSSPSLGAIQPRYRLLVLLATFAQLRFGELVALRRRHVDMATMELRVVKATAEMDDGIQIDDDPMSDAGRRTTQPAGSSAHRHRSASVPVRPTGTIGPALRRPGGRHTP
jgi:hypothetical protein